MSTYNTLVQKLFNKDLTVSEWTLLFDEWDTDGKISWLSPFDETTTTHLLGYWSSTNIPDWAIRQITERHGKDIWMAPDQSGNHSLKKMISMMPNRTSNEVYKSSLATMLKVVDLDAVHEIIKSTECKNGFAGFDDEFWTGKLRTVAYFAHHRQFNGLASMMMRDPDLKDTTYKGWNAAALMCRSEEGWNAYISAGGSIFDPIHLNPHDGKEMNAPMPLWLWLMQKKTYHTGLKTMLESLMTRLAEDRPPQSGEVVLSDEHWQQLMDNKVEISFQTSMIEFEKTIEQDWKAAIKSNKQWRKWRSNDGANIIHWLAVKHINEFVRQTHKIQKNHSLMTDTDNMGNDIYSYFALGALTGDWGTHRRREKLISTSWEDASRTIRNLSNANPERGLLAQWIMAENNGFFGVVDKLKEYRLNGVGRDRHFWSEVKATPERIWNGMTDEVVERIFQSPNVTSRIQGVAAAAFHEMCQTGNVFRHLSDNASIGLLAAISTVDNLYRMPTQYKDILIKELDRLMAQDNNLSVSFFQGALGWVKSQKTTWQADEYQNRLESWLSQQALSKQLEQSLATEEQAPAPQRKKRM